VPRGAAAFRHPPAIEVISMADVSAGTGLGSSSCLPGNTNGVGLSFAHYLWGDP
jgi:galactokinase/mevalonate kinase-like predicted kinase